MALIGSNQVITTHNLTVFNVTEQMFINYTKEFDTSSDIGGNDFGYDIKRQKLIVTRIPYKFTWELIALTNSFVIPLVTEIGDYVNDLKGNSSVNSWSLEDNRIKSRDVLVIGSPFNDLIFSTHNIYIKEVNYEEINGDYSKLTMEAIEVFTQEVV